MSRGPGVYFESWIYKNNCYSDINNCYFIITIQWMIITIINKTNLYIVNLLFWQLSTLIKSSWKNIHWNLYIYLQKLLEAICWYKTGWSGTWKALHKFTNIESIKWSVGNSTSINPVTWQPLLGWLFWYLIQYKALIIPYRKSLCGDKVTTRASYLHNGISCTGKITFLYWIIPKVSRFLAKSLQLI